MHRGFAVLGLSVLSRILSAQAGLGHLEDATIAPKGFFRFRAINAWTRSDSRFTADSTVPFGSPFTADAFGADKFAPLASIQTLVNDASASPFTLNLGRAQLNATSREEITPLSLEYGVTNRLSVSVVVPMVRKRVSALFRLDTLGGFTANVGPNPHRTSTTASQANTAVETQFATAATQLQNLLTTCQSNPGAAGCSGVNGRETQAQALIQSSQSFASTVASLYGGSSSSGSAFVPLAGSTSQAAIETRVSDFNTQYRDFLSSGSNVITATPRGAGGIASVSQFQNYLTDDLGRDSIVTQERLLTGDVEIGAKFLAVSRPRSEQNRTGLFVALASSLRLPTGSRKSVTEAADLRIGGGSLVIDSRAIADVRAGRLGLLAAGHFATSLQDVDTVGVAERDSRWTEVHIAPRWHLSEPFSVHLAYSLRSADKTGGDQMIGGGVSFLRGGSNQAPVEMRFTHLETISGDPGRPKFFREQLELRIYFRLLGR
jgi:hypothetical protein